MLALIFFSKGSLLAFYFHLHISAAAYETIFDSRKCEKFFPCAFDVTFFF